MIECRGPGTYLILCLAEPPAKYAGWRYFGRAFNLRARANSHVYALREGNHSNKRLQEAWVLYGAKAFSFQALQEFDATGAELDQTLASAEQALIDDHYGEHCFNIAAHAVPVTRKVRNYAATSFRLPPIILEWLEREATMLETTVGERIKDHLLSVFMTHIPFVRAPDRSPERQSEDFKAVAETDELQGV